MRTQIKHPLWPFIIGVFISFSVGCATPTKPNVPYSVPVSALDEMAKKNPLFVPELRKLPELQDGISKVERRSINSLVKLIDDSPGPFGSAFDKMYKVGLPDVRKYCSPLQAFFWLVEDGKLERCKEILNTYSLNNLLNNAWNLQETIYLSMEQLKVIIESLPQKEQGIYGSLRQRDIDSCITLSLFKHSPEVFSEESKKIIKDAIGRSKYHLRWGVYEAVVERLNAPELINYYEQASFSYVSHGGCPGHAKYIFKSKRGCCSCYTAFSVQCLLKAGYEAKAIKVVSPTNKSYHEVCEYEENGMEYIMDNSCSICGSGAGITEKQSYLRELPEIGTGYR